MSSDYYTDPEDEGDPSIFIVWAGDAEIHQAAGLPQAPAGLRGANPAASKNNVVKWFDDVILASVQPGVNVIDRDGDGLVVPGSYSGLRGGEWSAVITALGTRQVRLWSGTMDTNVPPLSCGKLRVSHGRGHNCTTTTYPRLGPFLS
jgi:hypothetical protein